MLISSPLQPTPLYFMDEIDAALDFRNVSIVANYIKDRTKNAQFIIISLRNVRTSRTSLWRAPSLTFPLHRTCRRISSTLLVSGGVADLCISRFELSSRLIGIYKVQNQTRSVAIGTSLSSLPSRWPADPFPSQTTAISPSSGLLPDHRLLPLYTPLRLCLVASLQSGISQHEHYQVREKNPGKLACSGGPCSTCEASEFALLPSASHSSASTLVP